MTSSLWKNEKLLIKCVNAKRIPRKIKKKYKFAIRLYKLQKDYTSCVFAYSSLPILCAPKEWRSINGK